MAVVELERLRVAVAVEYVDDASVLDSIERSTFVGVESAAVVVWPLASSAAS